jgi:hypothetical protein
MSKTTMSVLEVLNDALDPQYSREAVEKKMLTALILAVVAVSEELETANDLKKREILKLYGDRIK